MRSEWSVFTVELKEYFSFSPSPNIETVSRYQVDEILRKAYLTSDHALFWGKKRVKKELL